MSKRALPADLQRYHRWLSTLSCANCGAFNHSQVAHYQGFRQESYGKSKAKKVDDWFVAPLCHVQANNCHGHADSYKLGVEVASLVIVAWDEISTRDQQEIARTYQSEVFHHWVLKYQRLARQQGVISEIKVVLP